MLTCHGDTVVKALAERKTRLRRQVFMRRPLPQRRNCSEKFPGCGYCSIMSRRSAMSGMPNVFAALCAKSNGNV